MEPFVVVKLDIASHRLYQLSITREVISVIQIGFHGLVPGFDMGIVIHALTTVNALYKARASERRSIRLCNVFNASI